MSHFPQVELADHSPVGLVDALCERIKGVLNDSWRYGNEHGSEIHTPHVHAQYLPIRKTADTDRDVSRDYPLVQVINTSGAMKESLDAGTAELVIGFGGWDDEADCQGWRIPALMLWAVLLDLLRNPFIGAYELIPPVEWELPSKSENDYPPYFHAMLTTTWRIVGITDELRYGQKDERFSIEDYQTLNKGNFADAKF